MNECPCKLTGQLTAVNKTSDQTHGLEALTYYDGLRNGGIIAVKGNLTIESHDLSHSGFLSLF